MARRRKPHQLKVIAGTDQKVRRRNGVEMPEVEGFPAPPEWLVSPDALREWNRVVPMLRATRTLMDPHLSMLAILCLQFGIIVGKVREGKEVTAAELSQYRMYCSEFALTPASQTRVQAEADGKPLNRFSTNGRRA